MAYDELLVDRLRELFAGEDGLDEVRMFGGLAFLIHGNMAVAASRQGGLLLRVDPADPRDLAAEPGAQPFVMRGRPLEGWLRIGSESIGTRRELETWVAMAIAYARSLPPKGPKPH